MYFLDGMHTHRHVVSLHDTLVTLNPSLWTINFSIVSKNGRLPVHDPGIDAHCCLQRDEQRMIPKAVEVGSSPFLVNIGPRWSLHPQEPIVDAVCLGSGEVSCLL